ncbi:Neuroblastoma-amplified sequence [Bagarius yarrelli]|uniref:Neuroblastoma-amplified sequence n=1 Tax=Bagarius yarrelli TaxID=175774 RepID=A0A556TZJ5_BAGYA|nr:Neuroblastoma-amplified sequence [Bagarius yarrelli]
MTERGGREEEERERREGERKKEKERKEDRRREGKRRKEEEKEREERRRKEEEKRERGGESREEEKRGGEEKEREEKERKEREETEREGRRRREGKKANPKDLIRLVTDHVTEHQGAEWDDDELEALIGQLQLYSERLTDFTQAQVLKSLGRGVDVQRFSNDSRYKKETILGLADLSTQEIENRSKSLGLFQTLKAEPQAFYTHMSKYVYPGIAGTDLQRLLYYYTLLESCSCTDYLPSFTMSPDTHVKLLKKLKAVANGLDYKKLTDEESDPLEALEPVLSSQNVLSISKLASRISQKGGGALTPSAVHSTWLPKLFWQGDAHILKKTPQSDQDYLNAYDICAKYLERLLPADAVQFLDSITFSQKATNQDRLRDYARAFDLSRSEEVKVHQLAVTMALDGQPLEQIEKLLTVAVGTSSLSAHGVVQDAVARIVATLSGDETILKDYADPLKVLEGIVKAVQEDVQGGGHAVSSEDLLAWLRPFCGDDSKPVRVRIEVLQILENSFSLSKQDVRLLVLFRSQAVLKACWPSRKCDMKDIEEEAQRHTLFLELLESSQKWEEFQHLMLLLQAWPPVTDESRDPLGLYRLESELNPWVCVTSAVLTHCSDWGNVDVGQEILTMCRSLYTTKHKLNTQDPRKSNQSECSLKLPVFASDSQPSVKESETSKCGVLTPIREHQYTITGKLLITVYHPTGVSLEPRACAAFTSAFLTDPTAFLSIADNTVFWLYPDEDEARLTTRQLLSCLPVPSL